MDQGETADPSGPNVSLACAAALVKILTDPNAIHLACFLWNYRLFEPFSPVPFMLVQAGAGTLLFISSVAG
jgi:hypothetical protein